MNLDQLERELAARRAGHRREVMVLAGAIAILLLLALVIYAVIGL